VTSLAAGDSLCSSGSLFSAANQLTPGRTGFISTPDATMPNPSGVTQLIDVDFVLGPIPGFPASPTNANLTLVVTPVAYSLFDEVQRKGLSLTWLRMRKSPPSPA